MKVLHLASFRGNLGDILSHSGFRPWFEELVGEEIDWVDLEIRDFYRRETSLLDLLTKNRSGASLIVIGGGNYWETWPTNSRTGTSLDITFDELDSLGLPVFFNALGVDVAQGVSDNSLKLPEFLQQCSLSNNFFVSVRNDGAAQNLRGTLGYDGDLAELPDHGFFALKRTGAPSSTRTAAVNLALDMENIRFASMSRDRQFEELSNFFEGKHSAEAWHLEFVPHVLGDLEALAAFGSNFSDRFRRERLAVSALNTTNAQGLRSFAAYETATISVANRFHANVAAISLGSRLLPFVNYPQIRFLLDTLPHAWPFPQIEPSINQNFSEALEETLLLDNRDFHDFSREVMKELDAQRGRVAEQLLDWLAQRRLR